MIDTISVEFDSLTDAMNELSSAVLSAAQNMRAFGITAAPHIAYRTYARDIWQQARKPRSVYRGGRWRQMDMLMQQQAIVWALNL